MSGRPAIQGLVAYEKMRGAIEARHRVDEAKDIRDKARALEVYARQANDRESEQKVHEIRMRAETKAGKLIKEAKEAGQMCEQSKGRPKKASHEARLSELGISYDQASTWQQMAEVPDELFEKLVTQPGMTSENIAAAARPKAPPIKVDPEALWIWGTLGDLVRRGLLKRSFRDLVKEMPLNMRRDCEKWAPTIRGWLEEPA